jgi:hypothetical protein
VLFDRAAGIGNPQSLHKPLDARSTNTKKSSYFAGAALAHKERDYVGVLIADLPEGSSNRHWVDVLPALSAAVVVILFVRPAKQVTRPYASTVVALVTHQQVIGNWAVIQREGKAMCRDNPAIDSYGSIAVSGRASPLPAARISDCHATQELCFTGIHG